MSSSVSGSIWSTSHKTSSRLQNTSQLFEAATRKSKRVGAASNVNTAKVCKFRSSSNRKTVIGADLTSAMMVSSYPYHPYIIHIGFTNLTKGINLIPSLSKAQRTHLICDGNWHGEPWNRCDPNSAFDHSTKLQCNECMDKPCWQSCPLKVDSAG